MGGAVNQIEVREVNDKSIVLPDDTVIAEVIIQGNEAFFSTGDEYYLMKESGDVEVVENYYRKKTQEYASDPVDSSIVLQNTTIGEVRNYLQSKPYT